jgi:hypothetical protein
VKFILPIACGLVLLAATGCTSGPKMTLVKGKLLYKGSPLKVDPKAGVQISFIPIVERGEAYSTYPASPPKREDMSFEVRGPQGKGIPPGKYRVAVNLLSAKDPLVDEINEGFSKQNTNVVREVRGEEGPVMLIDLSKPEG